MDYVFGKRRVFVTRDNINIFTISKFVLENSRKITDILSEDSRIEYFKSFEHYLLFDIASLIITPTNICEILDIKMSLWIISKELDYRIFEFFVSERRRNLQEQTIVMNMFLHCKNKYSYYTKIWEQVTFFYESRTRINVKIIYTENSYYLSDRKEDGTIDYYCFPGSVEYAKNMDYNFYIKYLTIG